MGEAWVKVLNYCRERGRIKERKGPTEKKSGSKNSSFWLFLSKN